MLKIEHVRMLALYLWYSMAMMEWKGGVYNYFTVYYPTIHYLSIHEIDPLLFSLSHCDVVYSSQPSSRQQRDSGTASALPSNTTYGLGAHEQTSPAHSLGPGQAHGV